VFPEVLSRLVEVQRESASVDRKSEIGPVVVRRRIDAKPDRGEKRIRLRVKHLDRLASGGRSLDLDRRRFAEGDFEAKVAFQRCLDDLLLDLAVERDRQLLAAVVLPDVD
jgi:hypothetical protein